MRLAKRQPLKRAHETLLIVYLRSEDRLSSQLERRGMRSLMQYLTAALVCLLP